MVASRCILGLTEFAESLSLLGETSWMTVSSYGQMTVNTSNTAKECNLEGKN